MCMGDSMPIHALVRGKFTMAISSSFRICKVRQMQSRQNLQFSLWGSLQMRNHRRESPFQPSLKALFQIQDRVPMEPMMLVG